MRRFGEAVVPGQKYRLRPGAYAVLVRDGQVLVTHQSRPRPEYQLPGGGIDPGEGPINALHREVFEETGWHVAGLRRLGAYRRFTYMPEYNRWAEKVCHVYLGRPVLQLGPPTEPGHRAIWMSPQAALDLLASAGDRNFLAQVVPK